MKRSLLAPLKSALQAQGITQAEAARRLRVSLPTLKRWLRGEGLDLASLERLLQLGGLTLTEWAQRTESATARTFHYTLEQERTLARHPELLALWDALLHQVPLKVALEEASLKGHAATLALKSLEGIGLIERLPKNKIKLLLQGEPHWRPEGALAQAFRRKAIQALIDSTRSQPNALKMGVYRLLPEDLPRLKAQLQELRETLRSAEIRGESAPHRTTPYACLTAFGPWNWNNLR
jgi:transcriptional regulator with XRE-family HTH domain